MTWIKFENVFTGEDVTINMDKVAKIVQKYEGDRSYLKLINEEGQMFAEVFGDEDELLKQLGGEEHIAYVG